MARRVAALLVVLLLCHSQQPGSASPTQQLRRRHAKLRHRATEHVQASSFYAPYSGQQLPKHLPALLDLTGSYSGTWTRLPEVDGVRAATAVGADAAAAVVSQQLEASGWPSILTRAISGRLLLKLHAGPPNSQSVAGIEGLLSVSEGALVLGPASKRLSVSGFTRLDSGHHQGVFAAMTPTMPTRISLPVNSAGGNSGASSSGSGSGAMGSMQQQLLRQQPPAHMPLATWLSSWGRPRSSTSLSQQLAWVLGTHPTAASSIDTDAYAYAAGARGAGQQQVHQAFVPEPDTTPGECRFRLELTVTQASEFWMAPVSPAFAAAAAAAAVPSGGAARRPPMGARQPPSSSSSRGASGSGQQAASMNVDSSDKAWWGVGWQHYLGLQQEAGFQQDTAAAAANAASFNAVPVNRRSAMEVAPPQVFNTVLQIAVGDTGAAGSVQQQGAMDEYAGEADYAAGYEAGYAAAAAEAGVVAAAAASAAASVAAAEAARSAAAAIAALPPQYQHPHHGAAPPQAQGGARTLQGRPMPDLQKLLAASSSVAAEWQSHASSLARSLIETDVGSSAPAAPSAAAPDSSSGSSSGSRYGVRSLFDAWLMPCSHSNRDSPYCRQEMQGSDGSSYGAPSSSSGVATYRRQPRLQIQGMLISDNCHARWALTAVALPPGGLEVQALWYALLALLMCLIQVIMLRKQAAAVTRSSAVALRVSLVGVCAGAQIDAFLSMAHLAASMSSPDISMPLLVVAAAQFALFAGADMTLLLHVWRAHDHHHEQQQRYGRQGEGSQGGAAAGDAVESGERSSSRAGTGGGGAAAATAASTEGLAAVTNQLLAAGGHMGPYRPTSFVTVWALPLVVLVALARHCLARARFLLTGGASGRSGGDSSPGLVDSLVQGVVQLASGRSLLMLYVRFYMVLLSATVLSWFMTSQLPLLLLAAFSFWVPQIWHNIANTARQPLQPAYMLASTAARLLLPVYLLCCPLNLLQLTPQPWLAGALLLWAGLQVAVLLLQHFTHPHVLLPAAWAPTRYNYHRAEVPWQFKEAAAQAALDAAAAAKAASCCGYDAEAHTCVSPPLEQPAGGGSGHLACCCTGVSGVCHLCSHRARTLLHETYGGSSSSSCTIRFLPRRQSSTAGGLALRTHRAQAAFSMQLAEAPGAALGGAQGAGQLSSSWGLQAASAGSSGGSAGASKGGSSSSYLSQACTRCGVALMASCYCHRSSNGGGGPAPSQPPPVSSSSRWASIADRSGACLPPPQQQQQQSGGGLSQQPTSVAAYPQASQVPAAAPLYCLGSSRGAGNSSGSSSASSVPADFQQAVQQELLPPLNAGGELELSTATRSSSSGVSSPALGSPVPLPASSEESLHDVVEGYDATTGDGVVECVICMAAVRLLPAAQRFVTPCGHFFHPECLTSWMEVKAECPQCRGPLPPL